MFCTDDQEWDMYKARFYQGLQNQASKSPSLLSNQFLSACYTRWLGGGSWGAGLSCQVPRVLSLSWEWRGLQWRLITVLSCPLRSSHPEAQVGIWQELPRRGGGLWPFLLSPDSGGGPCTRREAVQVSVNVPRPWHLTCQQERWVGRGSIRPVILLGKESSMENFPGGRARQEGAGFV